LDALRAIMREHRLRATDIAAIEVGVGHMTYVHTAWPYRPAGVTAAQMNLFFGLATMAARGEATPEDYVEERLADPALLEFMGRITASEDDEINARGRAARHACRMTVVTRSGERLHKDIYDRLGSPENPVDRVALEAKFRGNVRHRLTEAQAARVMAIVADFERLEHSGELTSIMAGAHR
jgi:2-methylcitrate dehydratase PrpD